MSIVKMKLVSVASTESNYEEMLIRCSKYEHLHAEPGNNIINDENEGQVMQEENMFAEYLNHLKNIGHSIGLNFDDTSEFKKEYTHGEIETFIDEVECQFKLVNNSTDSSNLTSDDEIALDKLREYDFKELNECEYVTFGLGRLPMDSYKKLQLHDQSKFIVQELHKTGQYAWIFYSTLVESQKEIKRLFDSLFFEEITIPKLDAKKIIEEYRERLLDVCAYVKHFNEIHKLHRYIAIIQEKYVLTGFVPIKKVDEFKQIFTGMDIKVSVNDPDDLPTLTPPTLLSNNRFFEPFDMFVEMYGLPAYKDLDPTPFVAVTFCLLFGIMFGDLGQGAVLALGGYLLNKKKPMKLAAIASRIGLFSMFFGFLYGSVFGLETLLNPIHQQLFGVKHKLIEVMDSNFTMPLLICAIAIGAILILITMTINITLNLKRKNYGEVLFSQNGFAGFIFYGYIICIATTMVLGGPNLMNPILMSICLGIPVACFLLKEPLVSLISGKGLKPHGTWGSYLLEAFFEAFEILLSFVTNTMSYLRVGGFVLSHAGMMLVVMTLVEMTGNAGIIVFIIGNIFVMCLEGLIVGIQTLRLEYYEMFSRYFEGGGKKFKLITEAN